jgi:hypothetical protein
MRIGATLIELPLEYLPTERLRERHRALAVVARELNLFAKLREPLRCACRRERLLLKGSNELFRPCKRCCPRRT